MKTKFVILLLALIFVVNETYGQKKIYPVTFSLTVVQNLRADLKSGGRLYIFINQNALVEPRTQTWPSPGNSVFAKNIAVFSANEIFELNSEGWTKTPDWNLNSIPEGEYYIQVLWDQSTEESNPNAGGNLYSDKQKVSLTKSTKLTFELSNKVAPRQLVSHDLVMLVDITSDTLSKWWKKPVHVKASILLPSKYKAGHVALPIRYNVAGYGGRYDRINRIVQDKKFMDWWQSDEAPQVINVFLDG